jgi:hypothetical protein
MNPIPGRPSHIFTSLVIAQQLENILGQRARIVLADQETGFFVSN